MFLAAKKLCTHQGCRLRTVDIFSREKPGDVEGKIQRASKQVSATSLYS